MLPRFKPESTDSSPMDQHRSIRRREYLGATVAAGATALAGCLGGSSASGPDGATQATYLDAPDSQVDPADLPYPGYGQAIPDVTLPAPLAGEAVSLRQFDTDLFVTFFYSHCQTVCPRLIGTLRNIKTAASSDGYADDVTAIAITFDPERDTEARLAEYAEAISLDREAGNWYFLRPESASRAETVVQEEFGVAFGRTQPEDMDMYMFNHFSLILLANAGNNVERAYTHKRPAWQELYDDFERLREREG
jgi:protein SCO1/2